MINYKLLKDESILFENTYKTLLLKIVDNNEIYYLNYIIYFEKTGIIYLFLDLSNLHLKSFNLFYKKNIKRLFLIDKIDIFTININIIDDLYTDNTSFYQLSNNYLTFIANRKDKSLKSWQLYIGLNGFVLTNYNLSIPYLAFLYEKSQIIFNENQYTNIFIDNVIVENNYVNNKTQLKSNININNFFEKNNINILDKKYTYFYKIHQNEIHKPIIN